MRKKKISFSGTKLMQGNEAIALGALAADCKFFAGYPITPASEIPEILSSKMFAENGVFMQMEDELCSICACVGASWGGSRVMTATSGPGFSLMQEGIGYGIVSETPLVIVDIMRGGPSTGQPTKSSQQDIMQVRYGSHGDYEVIALTPSDAQEAFQFTVRAFNLADEYRVPVFVMADEVVGHTREKVNIPEEVEIFDDKYEGICREYYKPDDRGIPPRIHFYEGHACLVDGQLHDSRGVRAGHDAKLSADAVRRYCHKITDNVDDITSVEKFNLDDAEIVLVAYGSVSRPCKQAVIEARKAGVKTGLLKLNNVWPCPEKEIEAACSNARKVIVPEMNMGQYLKEVQRIAGKDKVVGLPSLGGVLHTPSVILEKVLEVK
jgi:2-oxoglutarate ferredoxin oxidoreductase subunit alpha